MLNENHLDYSEYDEDVESDEILIKNSMTAMKCFSESYDDNSDLDSLIDYEKCPDIFANYSPIEYSLDYFRRYGEANEFSEQSLMTINETYIEWMIQPISKLSSTVCFLIWHRSSREEFDPNSKLLRSRYV